MVKYRHISRLSAEKAIRNVMRKTAPGMEQDKIVRHIKWEYEYQKPHGHWASKYSSKDKKFNW